MQNVSFGSPGRYVDILDRVRSGLRMWRRRHETLKAAAALRGLSDRTLKDLGMDRSEALSVALAPDGTERRRHRARPGRT